MASFTRDKKNTIETEIASLKNIDIENRLFTAYPQKTIGDIVISRFTGESFIFYIERIIENFSQQFIGSDWQFWTTNSVNPQGQSIDIASALSQLRINISNNQFQAAESFLWAIVNYQIINSFWSNKGTNTTKRAKINEMLSNLNARKEEYDTHMRDLLSQVTKLTNELNKKTSELTDIENSKNKLSGILQDAENIFDKYNTVDNDIQSKKEGISTIINDINKELSSANEFKDKIQSDLKAINEIKNDVDKNVAYIEDKANEVTDLAGRTSDNALAFSFNKRKDELIERVDFWKKKGIAGAFLLSALWLLISYNFIEIQTNSEILKLLFFTGKLSLSLLLLIFAFREYMKERKLLEDYSFKTAVAFTVNSYADQIAMHRNINESDAEYYELLKSKEIARQSFIENTVKDLYKSPSYSIDSSIKNVSLNPLELIKNKNQDPTSNAITSTNK